MKRTDQAIVARGLSSAASYASLPYLPIWMINTHAYNTSVIGTVVALQILSLRTGGLFSRPVLHLLQNVNTLMACYGIASAALACLVVTGFVGTLPAVVLIVLLCLNGVATSVGNVITKSFIARHTVPDQRVHSFGLLNRAINGGAAIGAIIGSLSINASPHSFAVMSIGLFFVAALSSRGLRGAVAPSDETPTRIKNLFEGWPKKVAFLLLTATLWVGYAQFFTALPVYAIGVNTQRYIGVFFAINACLIVLFQSKVLMLAQPLLGKPIHELRLYLGGVALMVMALLGLLSTRSALWPLLFIAIAIFTLSELLWSPLLDAWTASVFGSRHLIDAYTASGLIWGASEAAGGAASIYYFAGVRHDGVFPWSYPVLFTCLLIAVTGLGLRYVILEPRALLEQARHVK